MLLCAEKLPRQGDEIWAYGVCHRLQERRGFTLGDLKASDSKACSWTFAAMK